VGINRSDRHRNVTGTPQSDKLGIKPLFIEGVSIFPKTSEWSVIFRDFPPGGDKQPRLSSKRSQTVIFRGRAKTCSVSGGPFLDELPSPDPGLDSSRHSLFSGYPRSLLLVRPISSKPEDRRERAAERWRRRRTGEVEGFRERCPI
jgi:hypothetical protein